MQCFRKLRVMKAIKYISDLGPDFSGRSVLPDKYEKINLFEVIKEIVDFEPFQLIVKVNNKANALMFIASKVAFFNKARKWVLYPMVINNTELLNKRLLNEEKTHRIVALRAYDQIKNKIEKV